MKAEKLRDHAADMLIRLIEFERKEEGGEKRNYSTDILTEIYCLERVIGALHSVDEVPMRKVGMYTLEGILIRSFDTCGKAATYLRTILNEVDEEMLIKAVHNGQDELLPYGYQWKFTATTDGSNGGEKKTPKRAQG